MPYNPPTYSDYVNAPLYRLYQIALDFQVWCVHRYHQFENVPILKALAPAFWWLNERAWEFRHWFYNPEGADRDILRDIVNASHAIGWLLFGGGFHEIFENLLGILRQVRDDPLGWLRERFSDLWGIPFPYRAKWDLAIWWVLDTFYPDINAILRDPGNWVYWRLITWLNEVGDRLERWIDQLILWLYHRLPWLRDFFEDPTGFIQSALGGFSWVVQALLTDPVSIIRRIVGDAFGFPQNWIYDPIGTLINALMRKLEEHENWRRVVLREWGERFLRWLWEGIF